MSRGVAVAALAVSIAWVIATQPQDDGFRPGHRGWVSAHTLAIARRATASNGFVGYTLSLASPAGRDFYYFDRYPVFFSAGLHIAQELFASDTTGQIRVARQVMNLVYALTLVAAVMLLVELGLSLEMAIAATALAGASYTMVAYRDMVHFDQPAVLGVVVLLWAIAGFRNGRTSALVLAATAFAVMSGRGYASFAVLGLWWIFDTLGNLGRGGGDSGGDDTSGGEQRRQRSLTDRLRSIVSSTPTRACLLGITIGAACLTYNVAVETRARAVPLAEVSIIKSAAQRLSLSESFNAKTQKRRDWQRFARSQEHGVALTAMPWSLHGPLRRHDVARVILVGIVLVVALGFAASRPEPARMVWLLACTAGPLWLVVMRNLAAFHPYTAISMLPLCLTFFAALLRAVPPRAGGAAAVVACGVLLFSTNASNREIVKLGRGLRHDTNDMENIARALQPRDAIAINGKLFPGVPFALGFYLPDHDILVGGRTTLMISRRKFGGDNLTPDNSGIFLIRFASPRPVRSSLARLHAGSNASGKKQRHRATTDPDRRSSSRR